MNSRPYQLNAFRVCVNSIGEPMQGEIHTPLQQETIPFHGVEDILLKMDTVFNRVGYPQAFQERRSFVKQADTNHYHGIPEAHLDSATMRSFLGDVRTVDVVVDSRRDSSWQGSVFLADGDYCGSFDGDIALMELLLHKM